MEPFAHVEHEAERDAEVVDLVLGVLAGHAPEPRRILDVGAGPGVGSCQLATRFPSATVVATDSSPAMLERAATRARAQGLAVETRVAALPSGLDGLGPVDVVWASQVLHHVHDLPAALAAIRTALAPGGVLAVVEQPHRHGIDVDAIGTAGFELVADEVVEAGGAVRQVVLARR